MTNKQTQLTQPIGFNTNNLIFSEKIPGGGGDVKFERIFISTVNPDGTTGDLIVSTPECNSGGLKENFDKATKELTSYSYSIYLHDRPPTQEQLDWVSSYNKIKDAIKAHLVEKADIMIADEPLEKSDLKRFGKMYQKADSNYGPSMYPKVLWYKDSNRFETSFFNVDTKEIINPLELLGARCRGQVALHIASVFIGTTISLQVKVYEANISPISTTRRTLLPRPQLSDNKFLGDNFLPQEIPQVKVENDEDYGSLDDDDEEEEPVKPKVVKKVVRKVRRVVKK